MTSGRGTSKFRLAGDIGRLVASEAFGARHKEKALAVPLFAAFR